MGKKQNNKGFEAFVNSIINDKPSTKKQDKSRKSQIVDAPEPVVETRQQEQGDADLLKMLNAGNSFSQGVKKSEEFESSNQQLGLGYAQKASKQELANLQRLKDLKQKYVSKAEETSSKPLTQQSTNGGLVGKSQLSKRIQKSHTDQLIEEKALKKQQKEIRSKEKKQESQVQQVDEQEAYIEDQKEPEKPKHFLKRNLKKTRSKQKNKRKDTRDPAYLANKFSSVGAIV